MDKTVYLDNSATTVPCPESVSAVNSCLSENWGNPSSLHSLGMAAEDTLENSRTTVAEFIGAKPSEIYFTSCGTEANNTALLGAALRRRKRGNRIVTTAVEHPSVLETLKRLENDGFEVVKLKTDNNGRVSEEDILSAVDKNTVLVSIMLVNNESGAIMPVEAAAKAIKQSGAPALLHCDAVQGFGKLPINVNKLGVDLLTASGHKIHAPKGVGFLYIKSGVSIDPLITGGGQERGMRSGTECVPLISGMAAAVKALPELKGQLAKQREICDYARNLFEKSGIITVNSSPDALPYIMNISVQGYRSETLLHFLEERNIFVSSGSACSKGKGSYVLSQMGLDRKRNDSALRISFSRYNEKEDIDILFSALTQAVKKLKGTGK